MWYLKTLGIYEHDLKYFFEKVCAHKRHRCKNFPYFRHFFSKVCLGSYTHLWHFLLCTESQMVPKKLAFNMCVLILNIWCFMDVCMGISQKMPFSYTKKQRIFYQIICLSKNKGFSTKSSNFKKRKIFFRKFSKLINSRVFPLGKR